jgi:uncharacterized protein (TIGR02271 family)
MPSPAGFVMPADVAGSDGEKSLIPRDVEPSASEEPELRRYYGLPNTDTASPNVDPPPVAPAERSPNANQEDADEPKSDDHDGDRRQPSRLGQRRNLLIRSGQRLKVGTETVPTGTARLRKAVVTEQVTVTVPVSHDEVRLVYEPITDDNGDAVAGEEITEQHQELGIVLHAERPVVTTTTAPVERVQGDHHGAVRTGSHR